MAYLLMIDDNPQSQRYIERIIRHRSTHEIDFASSSVEAVEKLVERRPEVIMLDLFIPGADGLEFFKSLRQHPATADIPIIIHTPVPLDPLTQMRLKRLARTVRYEGFLQFPVEASELNRIIAIALKRNASGARKWIPPSV